MKNKYLQISFIISLLLHSAVTIFLPINNRYFYIDTKKNVITIYTEKNQFKDQVINDIKTKENIDNAKINTSDTNKKNDIVPEKYFKSSELTVKPSVLQDIDQSKIIGYFISRNKPIILFIYINQFGTVDRVDIENFEYTESESSDIRDAFMAMKFTPGEIIGTQVKTVLKTELFLNVESDDGSKR